MQNLYLPNDPTARKIMSFRELPGGWHFGTGIPPTEETLIKAQQLNAEALAAGFKSTDAFPGIGGEIQVTAYYQSIFVEMTVEIDGLITYVYESAGREIEYRKMTLDELVAKVREFRGILWALSDSLINNTTMIPQDIASPASPFELQATQVAFPLLTQIASFELAEQNANISSGFIRTLAEVPQYFGTFLLKNSPRIVVSSAKLSIQGMIAMGTS